MNKNSLQVEQPKKRSQIRQKLGKEYFCLKKKALDYRSRKISKTAIGRSFTD